MLESRRHATCTNAVLDYTVNARGPNRSPRTNRDLGGFCRLHLLVNGGDFPEQTAVDGHLELFEEQERAL